MCALQYLHHTFFDSHGSLTSCLFTKVLQRSSGGAGCKIVQSCINLHMWRCLSSQRRLRFQWWKWQDEIAGIVARAQNPSWRTRLWTTNRFVPWSADVDTMKHDTIDFRQICSLLASVRPRSVFEFRFILSKLWPVQDASFIFTSFGKSSRGQARKDWT